MQEGDVIRFALQQDDRKYVKRPAVILKKFPPYQDYLVCGISKSLGLETKGLDIIITYDDPDFSTWGLNYEGIIRTGFLFTISSRYIEGSLGNISYETRKKLLRNLSSFLLRS